MQNACMVAAPPFHVVVKNPDCLLPVHVEVKGEEAATVTALHLAAAQAAHAVALGIFMFEKVAQSAKVVYVSNHTRIY